MRRLKSDVRGLEQELDWWELPIFVEVSAVCSIVPARLSNLSADLI